LPEVLGETKHTSGFGVGASARRSVLNKQLPLAWTIPLQDCWLSLGTLSSNDSPVLTANIRMRSCLRYLNGWCLELLLPLAGTQRRGFSHAAAPCYRLMPALQPPFENSSVLISMLQFCHLMAASTYVSRTISNITVQQQLNFAGMNLQSVFAIATLCFCLVVVGSLALGL